MSIFDDLSKDSFLSKRATSKQSGRRADAEVASDLAARNKSDTEVGSDLAARNKSDAEVGSDFSMNDDNTASDPGGKGSDLSTGKNGYWATSKTNDTDTDTDVVSKNNISSDKNPKNDADTEFSSDMTSAGMDKADAEAASDMGFGPGAQYGTQTYSHAGVAFNKLSDGEAKINYAGLLTKDGAQEVIGVFGYGSNQSWENVSTIRLDRDYSGNFTANIPIVNGKNINFAFKDTAENWDNNSGLNYTFVN